MWLDFDIFLVRHPTKALQQASQGYDLLMGYDLESDCLCNLALQHLRGPLSLQNDKQPPYGNGKKGNVDTATIAEPETGPAINVLFRWSSSVERR